MMQSIKRALPALLILTAVSAPAQFSKLHGAAVSVGATGNFVTPLTTNSRPVTFNSVTPNGITLTNTYSNQSQYITSSVGFLTSLQFHPVPWAGIEMNYGYQHYSERYNFTSSRAAGTQTSNIPTTAHEATAAYQFHPKHIPFQPFVNIGGGAIDFIPTAGGPNQWRGAGLLETGFDIAMPATQRKLALRIQGRGLFYRAPNFNNSSLSTASWRASAQPSASFVYRF